MGSIEGMISAAEDDLGLGEPNYIHQWYNDNYQNLGRNWAWCDAAVSWWAHKSGNARAVVFADNAAIVWTPSHAQGFRDRGQWTFGISGIRRGDVVFFDWNGVDSIGAIDHVGVVTGTSSDGREVYTIEGNIDNTCARRTRGAYEIAGYGRPSYAETDDPDPAPSDEYVVRSGDTLFSIAARFDIEGGWRALYEANSAVLTDPDLLVPGMRLRIPGSEVEPEQPVEYTVRPGDTLSSIAAEFDVDGGWQALHEANRSTVPDPNVLEVGQVLLLPAGSDPGPDPDPDPDPDPGPGETLKSAGARHGMKMGAAVADGLLSSSEWTGLLKREYSVVTAENVMKFGNIHPQPDVFNWAAADRLVDFAQANGIDVHGHTLLWHRDMPSWADESDLEAHINAIVGRYRGRVQSWDVVNEVLNEDGSLRDVWFAQLVARAFRLAHAADPDAKLYINDFNIETDRVKSDEMYAFVQELLDDGVPIHGVGFQCHFNTEWTPAGELEVNLRRFKALGLEVAVTEFDCALKNGGTLAQQADHYRGMVEAAVDAGASKFITWGFTDASTWLPGQDPLPFDADGDPKPAHAAMLAALNDGAVEPEPEDPEPEEFDAQDIHDWAAGGADESSGVYTEGWSGGSVRVKRKDGALYWKSGMSIDCDGQPGSACNINTDPYFQAQTAFQQSNGQHLKAEELPFVVVPLPSSRWDYHEDSGLSGGDLVVMAYGDKFVYGVVGDLGPAQRIGEGSYAAAAALGINPDPVRGGIGSGVTYVAFPGVKVSPIESKSEAARLGAVHMAELLDSPAPEEPEEPEVPGDYTPPPFPSGLRPDSASPSARELQKAFKAVGLIAQSVALADNYGPKTQEATAKWYNLPENHDIRVSTNDKAIGPLGWARLFTKAYGQAEPDPEPEPEPGPGGKPLAGKTVKQAEVYLGAPVNGSVRTVQDALNREFGDVVIDGDYGPQTKAAYTKWQLKLWPGASTSPGGDADGHAAPTSLGLLRDKYGFTLVAGSPPSSGGEPAHDYSRTTYSGRTVNRRTVTMINRAREFNGGASLTVTQGSYNAGGVSASAGTHDGGGVIDVAAAGLSSSARNGWVTALRRAGFAAWLRTPSEGPWGYHIHAVAIGDRQMSSSARNQVSAYFNGRNALANNGPDTHPGGRPFPAWAGNYR